MSMLVLIICFILFDWVTPPTSISTFEFDNEFLNATFKAPAITEAWVNKDIPPIYRVNPDDSTVVMHS